MAHGDTANAPEAPIVVACLGDSITRGVGGFDWVAELADRRQNGRFNFRNFGVDGDLAYSALGRLQSVIDVNPDVVIVGIGTNDITSLVVESIGRLLRTQKRLPQDPSPQWFEENLAAIASRLRSATSARVVLASHPQMGEDPTSTEPLQAELNRRFEEYAGIVQRVAIANGADYLPLYESMHGAIVAEPGNAATGFSFSGYYVNLVRQHVLHQDLDDIGRRNGWRFHIDGLHLNRRGGMILAELVQQVLDETESDIGARVD